MSDTARINCPVRASLTPAGTTTAAQAELTLPSSTQLLAASTPFTAQAQQSFSCLLPIACLNTRHATCALQGCLLWHHSRHMHTNRTCIPRQISGLQQNCSESPSHQQQQQQPAAENACNNSNYLSRLQHHLYSAGVYMHVATHIGNSNMLLHVLCLCIASCFRVTAGGPPVCLQATSW
jgi:hypothetical protein